jgi:hypothetical protein
MVREISGRPPVPEDYGTDPLGTRKSWCNTLRLLLVEIYQREFFVPQLTDLSSAGTETGRGCIPALRASRIWCRMWNMSRHNFRSENELMKIRPFFRQKSGPIFGVTEIKVAFQQDLQLPLQSNRFYLAGNLRAWLWRPAVSPTSPPVSATNSGWELQASTALEGRWFPSRILWASWLFAVLSVSLEG